MWYSVNCCQLMSQFDYYQLQLVYLTVEHCSVRSLQHETLPTIFDTFRQSQRLLHTQHKSILHFSCSYLS